MEAKLRNKVMGYPKEIAVVDYGMGNVWSVISAFQYLGAMAHLVEDPELLTKYKYIVLPGVGSFRKGMEALKARGLDKAIIESVHSNAVSLLGICLGMQLMAEVGTEDGETKGLGLVPLRVDRFEVDELDGRKVPHVGFNSIRAHTKDGFFAGLDDKSDFYFTHSYRMLPLGIDCNIATCSYGVDFLAAFQLDSLFGAQFHPEKSQTNGLIMLKNFLENSPC